MDRREFLAKAGIAATWAGVAIRVSACSDDTPMSTGNGGGGGDAVGTVTGGGHSHAGAVVTEAQLNAGNAVTLMLTQGHMHTVSLSAQDVMDIASGTVVSRSTDSDGTGHTHTVTFN